MLQVYQTDSKTGFVAELSPEITGGTNLANKWLHLTNPTDREVELVARASGAPEDFIKAALDEEERARMEIDDDCTLVIFDIPTIEDEDDYYSYSTMPFGYILAPNCVITVCLKETAITHAFVNGRVKGFSTFLRTRFLLQLMYTSHTKFLQYLRQIDKSSSRIENELHKSTKNKELIQLLDLEKSLVYFSTSLKANCTVIEKLTKNSAVKKYEEDNDLLDDLAIENRQAIEMCNIYRDIMSGTMDAYASVISNNLNIVMKRLTVLTVILSIPTLIASFWGMNTGVPFQGKIWGFYVVAVISILAGFASYWFLRKKS